MRTFERIFVEKSQEKERNSRILLALLLHNTVVRDLKSAVNKEYLNEKFLKKDKDGNDFDLKQKTVKNCEPYYDGLFGTNDLVSKAFVDAEIDAETDVLKLDGSRQMVGNLDMDDLAIIGIKSSAADNSALTVGGAKSTYFPLLGDRSVQGSLNMGGNPIINIKAFVEDDSSGAASDTQKKKLLLLVILKIREVN